MAYCDPNHQKLAQNYNDPETPIEIEIFGFGMHRLFSCRALICRRRAGAFSPKFLASSSSSASSLQSRRSSPSLTRRDLSDAAHAPSNENNKAIMTDSFDMFLFNLSLDDEATLQGL